MKIIFDYSNYGLMKESAASSRRFIKVARALGLKNRYLRFLITVDKNKSIVELGCGGGAFIKELIGEGFINVHGVEPSGTYTKVVESSFITEDFAAPYLIKIPSSSLGAVIVTSSPNSGQFGVGLSWL